MDKKAYVWLFNNLTRYQFSTVEVKALRDTISKMQITEETIESDEVCGPMENCYRRFVELFYNNVYGYQNGLVNKPICAMDLDCYFIDTSEGMLPIGYYKRIRPAEAVITVQRYLEICADTINTEKNQIAVEWQRRTGAVSQKFNAIKNSGSPSTVKAVLGIVSSVLLLIMSIVSLFRMNLIGVILGMNNPQLLKAALASSPFNSSGDIGIWIAYLIFVIVCMLIVFIGGLCTIMEFRSLKEKNNTEDLLRNIASYINTLDGGVNYAVSNGNEMIKNAIRRGDNMILSPNNNCMLISRVNKQIQKAEDYTSKTAFQRSGIWYAVIAIIFILFILLTLSQFSAVTNAFDGAFSSSSSTANVSNNGNSSSSGNGGNTSGSSVPDKPKTSRYIARKENVTWTQAQANAAYEGGNIITINDYAEFEKACSLADQANLTVCWLGCRISSGELWDDAVCLDGTRLYVPVWFSRNGITEPTYKDDLGNEELFLMMFKVNGQWYFNDAANDAIAASLNMYNGKIGYIIEIEE